MSILVKARLYLISFLLVFVGSSFVLQGASSSPNATEHTALLINDSGDDPLASAAPKQEHRYSYLRYGIQMVALSGLYLGFNWCFGELIDLIPTKYDSMTSAAQAARLAINFSLMSPWLTPLQSRLNRLFFRMGYHYRPKASGPSGRQMEEQWTRRMQGLTLNQQIMIDRIAQVHAAIKADFLLIIDNINCRKDKLSQQDLQSFCLDQVACLFFDFKRFYIDFDPQDEAIVTLFKRDLSHLFELCSLNSLDHRIKQELQSKIQKLYDDHNESYNPNYIARQLSYWIP